MFVLILGKNNPKIYKRSIECILIGYNINSKAYQYYERTTRKVYSSYHIKFIESHNDASTAAQPIAHENSEGFNFTTINEIE